MKNKYYPRSKSMVATELEKKYRVFAKRFIRYHMRRKGYTNKKLLEGFQKMEPNETLSSLSWKINRGTFSFAWLLQAMQAMNCEVDIYDLPDRN